MCAPKYFRFGVVPMIELLIKTMLLPAVTQIDTNKKYEYLQLHVLING
jgi:hypothetical protein